MPQDPIDLRILKALCTTLESITETAGYQHTLTGRVYRGRAVLTEKDGLPALAVNEQPVMVEQLFQPDGSPVAKNTHSLIIQGFVEQDRQHPTDPAYRLLADVRRRLAFERTRNQGFNMLGLGARIHSLKLGRGVVWMPDAFGSAQADFWLPVSLEYGMDYQNPFA